MAHDPTAGGDPEARRATDESGSDDPRLEDPTLDAPWKDLGPRPDLPEDEVERRAARPDPHGGT
jgi:hypothetical protein